MPSNSNRVSALLTDTFRRGLSWSSAAIGPMVGAYLTYVGTKWLCYGCKSHGLNGACSDTELDRLMPVCEVNERHRVHVAAPQDITFQATCETDLLRSAIIRAIFKARAVMLRSVPPLIGTSDFTCWVP
jgi:hypothetical protein